VKKFTLFVFTLLLSQGVFADAAGEIKYRQGVMEVAGGHMNSLVAILRGRVHINDVKFHAKGIANLATLVPEVFPKGSGDGKTDALPSVWEKPEAFKTAMDRFTDAAANIAGAAESGDMSKIGPAMTALGDSCKGCHEDFRAEHD
jgi:cytochrome c556|tara:strand:- start:17 stop:451 length:435 start_codon:yes stop_codon:yes gene_type:complete